MFCSVELGCLKDIITFIAVLIELLENCIVLDDCFFTVFHEVFIILLLFFPKDVVG